ncbi:MAG TPA: hypothetical protein VMZ52_12040 [Bryobacteraceae bacterium]|nr:hypothetical protein [Bryobacteraceae bacterium]
MSAADRAQSRDLRSYSASRRYTIQNPGKHKEAVVTARLEYTDKTGKVIKVLKEEGSEGLFRRVLYKVLDGEIEASRKIEHDDARIDAKNYNFRLLGTETTSGRRCYMLEMIPKKSSKYLMVGKLWVDTEDFGIVRFEGRPAASLGFWVGKPHIVQTFQKVGPSWFLLQNKSVADVKLLGKTELTIEGYDIQIPSRAGTVASTRKHALVKATVQD